MHKFSEKEIIRMLCNYAGEIFPNGWLKWWDDPSHVHANPIRFSGLQVIVIKGSKSQQIVAEEQRVEQEVQEVLMHPSVSMEPSHKYGKLWQQMGFVCFCFLLNDMVTVSDYDDASVECCTVSVFSLSEMIALPTLWCWPGLGSADSRGTLMCSCTWIHCLPAPQTKSNYPRYGTTQLQREYWMIPGTEL